jgi:hypothetical protein
MKFGLVVPEPLGSFLSLILAREYEKTLKDV